MNKKRSASTRERILLAASGEFAEKGYRGTTIRAICRRAGVNLASVNYHFSGKESLYRQVFDYLFDKTDGEISAILSGGRRGNFREWKKSLRDWTRAFIGMIVSDKILIRRKYMIICREMNDPSGIFPKLFDASLRPRFKFLEDHFRMMLPQKTSSETTYFLVFSVVSQCFFHFQNRAIVNSLFPGDRYLADNADRFADLIVEQACTSLKIIGSGKGAR